MKRLKEENRRLKAELSRRAKELSFFIDSGKALTSALEVRKILRIILQRAQRLIKCEAWALLLIRDEKQLEFVATKGNRDKGKTKRSPIQVGQGIAGWVAKTGQSILCQDVTKDRRFQKEVDQVPPLDTRSVLCVPIVNKKQVVGVLEMINKLGDDPFNEKDKELVALFVDQAAIAMERANLYQQMSDLAVTDDLTKLFNFRHLDQRLDQEIARCQRYGSVLSLIFLDMDYFKQVNDNQGHLMGSRVLIEVAQILSNSLRGVDVVARYGGDEFVVLLPETSGKTALRITQRLQRAITEHEFLKEEGLKMQLTASFGISSFPEHAKVKKDLIRLADQAMYRAKNTGRNRICVSEGGALAGYEGFSSFSETASGSLPAASSRSPKRSKRRSASS
jgi:diguanylate cyclase (GGDEF)-like protein